MLADVPMVFILVGITAYTVLSGADFGAGLWTLVPGGGQAGAAATRDHTRHAIGPVWEANHVWLIFVLTVAWTCYPGAFGSIVSTLAVPLLIAAIGIIFRGTAYALRSQFSRDEEHGVRLVEYLFALSSVLTPFALATVIGAIATGRVPVGNARGDLVTSWLNPVSVLAGVLAVAFSGYLAAVYLAADARRLAERALVHDFRIRALASGVVAGALALAGLLVIRVSAVSLWHGLTSGLGLALVVVSALAGVVTMVLVFLGRFGRPGCRRRSRWRRSSRAGPAGLEHLLGALDDITVVGVASGGAEAIRLAAKHAPDVVLMDLEMPGMDGIETTQAESAPAEPQAAVVVLTSFSDRERILAALEHRRRGLFLKDADPDELARTIRAAARGEARCTRSPRASSSTATAPARS